MSSPSATPTPGGLTPLRQQTFAILWVATIVGNTGSFIRDVASSWLVTDLSNAPAAVAAVQAAGTLPIFPWRILHELVGYNLPGGWMGRCHNPLLSRHALPRDRDHRDHRIDTSHFDRRHDHGPDRSHIVNGKAFRED